MIIETFRQAIQNVWSNKLRTFLTMLGIIIGVMAVIVIVGLGNGMTKSMRDSFSAMGTNTLNINVWGYGSRTISVDDVYAIAEKNPELIQSVSPQIDFSGSGDLKIGTSTYRWLNIYGVDEDYTTLKNYTIAKGRGLQYMDIKDNKQVCIIGDYLNRVAFGGNGVGQTLKIGANKFRIVGVLAAKVSDPSLQEGSDDACVYLPYTTVMRLSNTSTNQSYIAIMTDESKANDAKAVMEAGLYNVLKSENAYYVYSASEFLEEMNKMIHMVIVILTGIASISLLVGGIGIMNIMLVSVTERTREIGIRKALGAKERVILAQFVVEAATTSALGGFLGIVLGYVVSMAANRILPMVASGVDVTVSPSFNSIAVAFGISVGIGVLFGYLPAKRAARLNPIEALRYDSGGSPDEKTSSRIPSRGQHGPVDAGAPGRSGGQCQHRRAAVHHAGRHGLHPDGGAERRGHPRGLCPDAGGLFHLPGERRLAGGRGHPVQGPARQLGVCALCPHRGAAGLDERLHRRHLPPGQRRDAGRGCHGSAQAAGL